MKSGYRARMAGALDRAGRYSVDEAVRAARGIALRRFDWQRRQSEADQRVNEARAKLAAVGVAALEAELRVALEQQASIAAELKALEQETLAARGSDQESIEATAEAL